jgi:TonB-dependent receptor
MHATKQHTPRPLGCVRLLAGLTAWLFLTLGLAAQSADTGTVAGTISDSTSKSFLAGAEVSVDGTSTRTYSGKDGDFSLKLTPGGYTLTVSYIGYPSKSVAVSVIAGETTAVPVLLGDDVVQLEAFKVEGLVEGQARALNQQKASQNIVNIISSDSFGDFPDKSIADAARRLPGITIERGQGQGEGRYVSIRGMNADFNAVSLNGVRVTVSNFDSASRSVPLDVVSAKSAETIEVSKALRPDEDADSIGGSIKIRTRSPFDRDGRSATIEGSVNYNSLISDYGSGFYLKETGYDVSGTFSDVIGKNRDWSIALTLNDRNTPYVSQSIDVRSWGTVTGPGAFAGFLAPTGILQQEFFDEVDQTGATIALEYRPSDDDQFRINTSYNVRDSRRGRQQLDVRYDLNQNFWVGPATATGDTITDFTADNRTFRQVRDFYESQELINLALDGKHKRGDNTITWLAGFNRGNFDGDPNKDLNLTFRSGFSDNSYQLGGAGGTYFPGYDTSLNRNNPANYRLTSVDLGTRFVTDDEFVLKSDFQRDTFILGGDGFWKVGTQARFKNRDLKTIDRFYDSTTNTVSLNTGGALNWNLANNFLGKGVAAVDYGPSSSVDGTYDYGFFIDPNISRAVIDQLITNGTLAFTPAGQLDSDLRSQAASYEATEDIYSLYGMAQTTIDKWTFMGGLRGEFTATSFDTFSGVSTGSLFTSVIPENESNNYLDLLPGAHIRYDATRDLVFRGAITRSISRASYTQLNPSRRIDNTALTVTQGDTDLDPTRSTNLDFIIDYYVGRVGLISAGAFYKKMDDNIYRLSRTDVGANIPGTPLANAASNYTISEFRNAKGADVYGVELGFERDLSFLPEPLDGFGVFSNFTVTKSEVDTGIPARSGLRTPLFGQVENSYNVGVTYQKYGFRSRVAYNWRDSYLDFGGLNADPRLDRYLDRIGSLDITASYAFRKGITLFTEFRNVTNSPDRAYAGNNSTRPTYNEYRDWSANLGLRWSL